MLIFPISLIPKYFPHEFQAMPRDYMTRMTLAILRDQRLRSEDRRTPEARRADLDWWRTILSYARRLAGHERTHLKQIKRSRTSIRFSPSDPRSPGSYPKSNPSCAGSLTGSNDVLAAGCGSPRHACDALFRLLPRETPVVFDTRPGEANLSSRNELWINFICAATKEYSTWGVAEARS